MENRTSVTRDLYVNGRYGCRALRNLFCTPLTGAGWFAHADGQSRRWPGMRSIRRGRQWSTSNPMEGVMRSLGRKTLALFQAKVGRCARCMRWSAKGAVLGGAGALAADYWWPDSGWSILVALAALSFTALWLVHLIVFAGRAARLLARSRGPESESRGGLASAVPPEPARRALLAGFVKVALLAAVATALPASLAAQCVQLPICCTSNDDCKCSKCCGEWKSPPCPQGICQPSC